MIFIMMTGLPASGKSMVADSLSKEYGAVVYSSDSLRRELYGSEDYQEDNGALFQELNKRIKSDLSNGRSVIYDACNISYRRRKSFLQEITRIQVQKTCMIVAKEYEHCIEDNRHRKRIVPEPVMKRMLMNFWIPQYYEGWDAIKIHFAKRKDIDDPADVWKLYDSFDQDNSHHSLTLGQHMLRTALYLSEHDRTDRSSDLYQAALWHDMGKPFTRTYEKRDGTWDNEAHYYSHHNVGAYQFMMMSLHAGMEANRLLSICNLIQWHMQPYTLEKNGGEAKFIKLVGQDFYDKLMRLHEADQAAH